MFRVYIYVYFYKMTVKCKSHAWNIVKQTNNLSSKIAQKQAKTWLYCFKTSIKENICSIDKTFWQWRAGVLTCGSEGSKRIPCFTVVLELLDRCLWAWFQWKRTRSPPSKLVTTDTRSTKTRPLIHMDTSHEGAWTTARCGWLSSLGWGLRGSDWTLW